MISCHFNNMEGSREHNAKQNKPVRGRQIPYGFTHMWTLRNKTNEHGKKRDIPKQTLNYGKQMVTRGEMSGEKGETDKGD